MAACVCCEAPTPAVELWSRVKGGTGQKCGFDEFQTLPECEAAAEPKKYRTLAYFREEEDPDPDCAVEITFALANPCDSETEGESDCFSDPPSCCASATFCGDETESWTLSSEFTTAEMIGIAEANMGSAEFGEPSPGGGEIATRSGDPTIEEYDSIAITSGQWRIEHNPTATCYLKVWLEKTTTLFLGLDESEEPIFETTTEDLPEPYIWEGSGTPCLGGAASAADKIIGVWSEDVQIDAPGVVSISIAAFSLFPELGKDDVDGTGYGKEE